MSEWSNRYPYTNNNVNLFAPARGGVYRLIYKNGEEYYVFYVGQSDDLQRRFGEHLSYSEPNECIKRYLHNFNCFFGFIEIASQFERDTLEVEEIKKYDPSCNT